MLINNCNNISCYGMMEDSEILDMQKKITKDWNLDIYVILNRMLTLIAIVISNFGIKALKYLVENLLQIEWKNGTVSNVVSKNGPKITIENIGFFLYCLLVMFFKLNFCKAHTFCFEPSLNNSVNEIFQK